MTTMMPTSSMPGIPNFRGAPLMTLPRTKMLRGLMALLLLPAAAGCAFGAFASLTGPEPSLVGGAVLAVLFFLALGLLGWVFLREMRRTTSLYDEGIEQTGAASTKALRWADVESIQFRSMKVHYGGLVGLAMRAAIERATTPRPGAEFDERLTNLTVKIAGPGTTIKLSSNDKGAGPALDEALRRVNPRLLELHVKRIQGSDTIAYGKVKLSSSTIAMGGKPIPFADVESLHVQNGKLQLKRRGKWLSTAVQVSAVPNLFVLLGAWARLSGAATVPPTAAAATTQGVVV
jgi:hypothetical protein